MTQVSINQAEPYFYVTQKNRTRLPLYQQGEYNTVYLNDGAEFQLEIFNPLHDRIGVKIYINDVAMQGLLILNPGQRAMIERYLNEARKFIFETYDVENSKEAIEAIINNGLIKVEFYKERTYNNLFIGYRAGWQNSGGMDNNFFGYPNEWAPYSGTINCSASNDVSAGSSISGACADANFSDDGSKNISNTASFNADSAPSRKLLKKSIKTGRINKGKHSDQKFDTTEFDSEFSPFLVREIKLNSIENKPIEINKIRKYCTTCGYRIRKTTWRFCPQCSHDLTI